VRWGAARTTPTAALFDYHDRYRISLAVCVCVCVRAGGRACGRQTELESHGEAVERTLRNAALCWLVNASSDLDLWVQAGVLSGYRTGSVPRTLSSYWGTSGNSSPDWLLVIEVMSGRAPAAGVPSLERVRFPVLVGALLITVALCAVTAALAQALFSIDVVYLEALSKDTRSAYQQQALTLLPLRRRGNLLLVTLVLISTGAQELTALLADALLSGGTGMSLVLSTALVFVFGNMLPVVYALQPAYGLRLAAACARVMRIVLVVFYPITFPLAWILDKTVGKSVLGVRAMNRNELSSLLQFMDEHQVGDLGREESAMLQATLMLRERTAGDVMTAADDVYMLSLDQVLDSRLALELVHKGHSRVPLYDGARDNIVAYLLVKGLIAYSPSERLTVRDIMLRYADRCVIATAPLEVSRSTSLEVLLAEFQRGHSHMAIVYERPQSKRPKERHFLGIVTLEDIIEDLLKQEIVDESDVYYDMQSKQPVTRAHAERFLSASSGTVAAYGTSRSCEASAARPAEAVATRAGGGAPAPIATSDITLPRRSIDLARSATTSMLLSSSYGAHGAPDTLSSRAVLGMRMPLSRLRGAGYISIREVDLKKLALRGRRKDTSETVPRRPKKSTDAPGSAARAASADGTDGPSLRPTAAQDRRDSTASLHSQPGVSLLDNQRMSLDGTDDTGNGSSSAIAGRTAPLPSSASTSYDSLAASAIPPSGSSYGDPVVQGAGDLVISGPDAPRRAEIGASSHYSDPEDEADDEIDEGYDDALSIRRSRSAYCIQMTDVTRSGLADLEAAAPGTAAEQQQQQQQEREQEQQVAPSTMCAASSRFRTRFWPIRGHSSDDALLTERSHASPDETGACAAGQSTARSTERTLLRRLLLAARLPRPGPME